LSTLAAPLALLGALTASGSIASAAAAPQAAPSADPVRTHQPNILVIVADDLGFADVGFIGAKMPTPNYARRSFLGK
jgi:hypothetical protein